MPGMHYFFRCCWLMKSRRCLNNTGYCQCFLLSFGADDKILLLKTQWRYQGGTDREVSFLLASFHNAWRCYPCYQRRREIISLAELWTLGVTITSDLERQAHGEMVASTFWECFILIGFQFHLTRENHCQVKNLWLIGLSLRGEPATITVINGHTLNDWDAG